MSEIKEREQGESMGAGDPVDNYDIGRWLKPIYIGGGLSLGELSGFAQTLAERTAGSSGPVYQIASFGDENPYAVRNILGGCSVINGLSPSFGIRHYNFLFDAYAEDIPTGESEPKRRYAFIVNDERLSFADWLAEAYYEDVFKMYISLQEQALEPESIWFLVQRNEFVAFVLQAISRTPVFLTGVQAEKTIYAEPCVELYGLKQGVSLDLADFDDIQPDPFPIGSKERLRMIARDIVKRTYGRPDVFGLRDVMALQSRLSTALADDHLERRFD